MAIDANPKVHHDRVLAGLSWPEGGNPFFYCIVAEKHGNAADHFINPLPILEIIDEGAIKGFSELAITLETLPHLHCNTIYAAIEPKYLGFIRNINSWRREEKLKISLKQTKSTSFESSLLRIKEYLVEKRLIFPDDSEIKGQLMRFSSAHLKDSADFYAVKALTMAIDAFQKTNVESMETPPDIRAWW